MKPGPGLLCGCTVPRGSPGWLHAVAVFLGLGMVALPAGDAWCSQIAVAAWCRGWCRCAARLDARFCRGLCGVPAPDGAGTPVVRVASVACCRCGEWMVAWGADVDGLEDVDAAVLCGATTLDGVRARTFVALVAAVARDGGGGVVMIAVFWVEVEELWFRAPAAIILASAGLPYVPGRGSETSSCWAPRATGPPPPPASRR